MKHLKFLFPAMFTDFRHDVYNKLPERKSADKAIRDHSGDGKQIQKYADDINPLAALIS